MKPNFKYIVVFIIGSLSIVFLVQLFWLKGLYNSIEAETEKKVFDCLNIANSYELEYRMDSIEASPKEDRYKGEISINQSVGNEEESGIGNKQFIKNKRVVKGGDTIQNVSEPLDEKFSLAQTERLTTVIKEAIHQAIDSIAPIRLDTVYSSLFNSFEEKGIRSEIYKIEIVNFDKDSIMQTMEFTEKIPSTPIIFNYKFDRENNLGYRFYIEPLTKTILQQMFGILATTCIIILILAFAFWYLIRTISQQKTLEEMKDDFTNNMTHELKTPIAVAYSATDALLNFGQGDDKEKRKKYLLVCKEQLEKLEGLVEQILSMSIERRLKLILKKEDVFIKSMLEVLTEQHRMKSEREIVFNLEVQPDDLTIYADKAHLTNVMSNLIDNAIKYSIEKPIIDITVKREGKFNIIVVKDNGIGVAQDKQKFLFEKFYRVPQGNKHNAKGYGIGLFYVKTIIEKHGGAIAVESTLGKGSEFTIKMPIE